MEGKPEYPGKTPDDELHGVCMARAYLAEHAARAGIKSAVSSSHLLVGLVVRTPVSKAAGLGLISVFKEKICQGRVRAVTWLSLFQWRCQTSDLTIAVPVAMSDQWLDYQCSSGDVRPVTWLSVFQWRCQTSDLTIAVPVATWDAGWQRVGVNTPWLSETETLICNFFLSVAARTIVWADPSQKYSSMLQGR